MIYWYIVGIVIPMKKWDTVLNENDITVKFSHFKTWI